MRGPSVRGARRLARGGVLFQYGEHGKQAQRSNDGPIVCPARQPMRKAGLGAATVQRRPVRMARCSALLDGKATPVVG